MTIKDKMRIKAPKLGSLKGKLMGEAVHPYSRGNNQNGEGKQPAIILTDLDLVIRSWNGGAEAMYGWPAEEVVNCPIGQIIPNWGAVSSSATLDMLIHSGHLEGEAVQERKDKTKVVVYTSLTLIPKKGSQPESLIIVNQEITRQKEKDEWLLKARRAYQMLSECNQAMVRINDESELLKRICHILVEEGGYRMAWIGFAEEDEKKSVRPVAQAGYEKGYLDTLGITWADTKRGRGPTGTAIRTGLPSVNQHIQTNPAFSAWRKEAEKRGYASSTAIPLATEERVLGALNVYAAEANAFEEAEVKLLSELADNLTFALTAIHACSEQTRMEKMLLAEKKRAQKYLDVAGVFLVALEKNGDVTLINKRGSEILGTEEAGILGGNWFDNYLPAHIASEQRAKFEKMLAGDPELLQYHETPVLNQTGEERLIAWHNTRLTNEEGNTIGMLCSGEDITERKHYEREIESIAITSRSLRDATTREEMLPIILSQLSKILKVDGAAIDIYHPEDQEYEIEMAWGLWEASTGDRMNLEQGITPQLILSQEPYFNNDVRGLPDERFSHPRLAKKVTAMAGVPLVAQEKAIGSLWIGKKSPISEEDIRVLTAIADIAASAINRATLRDQSEQLLQLSTRNTEELAERVKELEEAREALKKRNVELARLYRTLESLVSSPKPNLLALAQNIVNSVTMEFEKSNCSVFLRHPNSDEINYLAMAGPNRREARPTSMRVEDKGFVPKAVRSGKLFNASDVFAEEDYVRTWEAARSELTIPLKVGGKVIGAIDIQSVQPRAFNAEDERLMSIFAERAALALENARLFTDAQRRLSQLQAIHDIDIAITSSLDLRLTLNILLAQVIGQLKVDAADLLLTTDFQTLKYAAGRGFRTRHLEKAQIQLGDSFAGQAALERRPTIIPDLSQVEMPPTFGQLAAEEGFTAYTAVPLIAKGEVKGVLEMYHSSPLDPNPEWMNFLESVSEQAAIAIHNAELYDDLQIAKVDLEVAYTATLEGWVRALDMRDQETEGHTQRVTQMTQILAREVGIPDEGLLHITRGALLHDIGKLAIPDSILRKAGPLNEQEWEIIRMHPTYAYEMLSPIKYLLPALDIPYSHHEKWDGSGYPRGLKGNEIPLPARIFAVVDVWDALRSDRPYRKAWPDEKVHQYLRSESNKHFDPEILEMFFEKVLGLPF